MNTIDRVQATPRYVAGYGHIFNREREGTIQPIGAKNKQGERV